MCESTLCSVLYRKIAIKLSFSTNLEAHLGKEIKHFFEATIPDGDLLFQTFFFN